MSREVMDDPIEQRKHRNVSRYEEPRLIDEDETNEDENRFCWECGEFLHEDLKDDIYEECYFKRYIRLGKVKYLDYFEGDDWDRDDHREIDYGD